MCTRTCSVPGACACVRTRTCSVLGACVLVLVPVASLVRARVLVPVASLVRARMLVEVRPAAERLAAVVALVRLETAVRHDVRF